MKKFLLSLCVAMLSVVGAWAQFYKFTETAQGYLYTAANDENVATTPKGGLCDQNYFVKSDYTALSNPLPFTFADGAQKFAVKDYYLNDGGNYTCAYQQTYVSTNTYATANATLITEENKSGYVGNVYKFTASGASSVSHVDRSGEYPTEGISVSVGEELDMDAEYWVYNSVHTGNEITTGYDGMTETVTGFTATNIYTLTDGIYTKISASDKYGDGKDYYAVEFNDLAVDYTFPDGTFSASKVIASIAEGNTVYYYNGSSYAEVQVGDQYLGEGKYFKYEPGFTSKTPAELVALGYVKAVGAITEVSEDGKTLTILCSGDVCEPDDEFSTEGYKFAMKAVNTIYPGEVENSVKQDEIYNENQEYYTRAQKYKQLGDDEEIPTSVKYTLNDNIVVYKENGNSYIYNYIASNTEVQNDGWKKLDNTETPIASLDDYTNTVTKFKDNVSGWIIKATVNADGSYNKTGDVNPGDVYDPATSYAKYTTQYYSATAEQLDETSLAEYLFDETRIKADANLFKKDGNNFVNVAGQLKEDIEYFDIAVSDINLTDAAYSTPTTIVNTNGKEYFTLSGVEYNQVANGSEFTGYQSDYYVKDGYDYTRIEEAALISDSYMTSATVAENYWQAMAYEINKNKYETVVFATKEGDAEKATICKQVTQAMMTTTTVNALDFLDVQIDEIKSPDATMTTDPEGTFVYPDNPYKENKTITILLLPEIKNAKANGHKHVPTYCAARVLNLNLVVMPNNATCIEKQAFTNQAKINTVILNDGLKMIGESAFDAARLNSLGIPESMEYIGKNAFGAGFLHDVYFYGKTAPIVEMDAFGSKAYVNNGAYNKPSQRSDFATMDKFDPENWKLDRWDYVNSDYMMAMLHLRTDLTDAERARFTDVSRDFHVFELTLLKDNDHYVNVVEESPLKSASTLRTETTAENNYGTNKAVTVYWNGIEENTTIESVGDFSQTAYNKFCVSQLNDHQEWENVTGYYDKTFGFQYKWPGQGDYNRSYAVATNNLLWDGKTNIAEGIQSYGGTYTALAYDSNCDGTEDRTFENGSEYIGIHQFVLVTTDVSPNTTPQEWDFNTLGGKNWYTICVPVDMTVAEVRKAFGDKTQVCKFNKVERDSNDKVKLGFTDEQCYGKADLDAIAIHANEAYMIRPSEYKDADHTFKLPQYTVAPQVIPNPTTLSCTDPADGKTYTYSFVGNYLTLADGSLLKMQQYCYYLGAVPGDPDTHKLFFQVGTTGNWKPYTCIVIPSDGKADYDTFFDPDRNSVNKAKAISSYLGTDSYEEEGNGGITTAIKYEIECGSENAPIYNLNGQFVGNSLNKLSRGVYVQNGKKFIVNK